MKSAKQAKGARGHLPKDAALSANAAHTLRAQGELVRLRRHGEGIRSSISDLQGLPPLLQASHQEMEAINHKCTELLRQIRHDQHKARLVSLVDNFSACTAPVGGGIPVLQLMNTLSLGAMPFVEMAIHCAGPGPKPNAPPVAIVIAH